jgi:sarcosine oxidase subunit alpha
LGLLSGAEARVGEILTAADPVRDGAVQVEVVPATFFDPEGARLRV